MLLARSDKSTQSFTWREIKAVANIINTDLANILDVKEVILISICSYKKNFKIIKHSLS